MAIQVGQPAPDFTLKTMGPEGMVDVKLSDNFGTSNTVLLFVPAAFSGPCTEELCGVTEDLDKYVAHGARVYGISPDTPFAQKAWADRDGIGIALLGDFNREAIGLYGVTLEDFVGLGPGSNRAAFVIDKQGVVRYAEITENPLVMPNFENLMSTLKELEELPE